MGRHVCFDVRSPLHGVVDAWSRGCGCRREEGENAAPGARWKYIGGGGGGNAYVDLEDADEGRLLHACREASRRNTFWEFWKGPRHDARDTRRDLRDQPLWSPEGWVCVCVRRQRWGKHHEAVMAGAVVSAAWEDEAKLREGDGAPQ